MTSQSHQGGIVQPSYKSTLNRACFNNNSIVIKSILLLKADSHFYLNSWMLLIERDF